METEAGQWKLQCASVVGTRNRQQKMPGADHAVVQVIGDLKVLVDSDGCGTSARASDGSRMVCEAFVEAVRAAAVTGFTSPASARLWIGEVTEAAHRTLREKAAGLLDLKACDVDYPDLRQFHATLMAAVICEPWFLFVSVGDGYAVIERSEHSYLASPPLRISEFENETAYFTGRDWSSFRTVTVIYDPQITGVVLTSDGLKNRLRSRPVHGPDGTITRPRIVPDAELHRLLSVLRVAPISHERLCEYLSNPANLAEGDDVSIALAVRRQDHS